MNIDEVITQARDATTARRVYGEPYEKNGLTVIPAASVRRGGRGGGESGEGEGSRAGFRLSARPVGAFVVKGDEVSWKPAVDATRIALGGQIVALVALLVIGSLLRRR